MEIRVEQRRNLYKLLRLKKQMEIGNEKKSVGYKELTGLINEMETEMDEADVAWVQKKISELKL